MKEENKNLVTFAIVFVIAQVAAAFAAYNSGESYLETAIIASILTPFCLLML